MALSFWDKLDDLDDNGAPVVQAPRCHICGVDMAISHDALICPSCRQEITYDLDTALQPTPGRTVVLSSNGTLHTYNQVVYDKHQQLLAIYNRFLKGHEDVAFPPDVIDRAISILLIVQKVSTNNRGRNLTELMGGALFTAALEAGFSVSETTMAQIFKTKSGLSRGKNAIITLLVKTASLNGEASREYLRKDTKRLRAKFIRSQMARVGLDPDNWRVYKFIKALTYIEDLYNYIDTQIVNAKLAGAIYYYHTWIIGATFVGPEPNAPFDVVKHIAAALKISKETFNKYYGKLIYARAAILLIAELLGFKHR